MSAIIGIVTRERSPIPSVSRMQRLVLIVVLAFVVSAKSGAQQSLLEARHAFRDPVDTACMASCQLIPGWKFVWMSNLSYVRT